MGAPIHFRCSVIKKARPLTAVAHSPKFAGATNFSDKRAAQESLKIQRHVRTQGARFPDPRPQGARRVQGRELAARENMDVIHVRITAQQGGPLRVDHPGDFSVRLRLANGRYRRQRVNDVTERARLDDENRTDFRFQISDCRLKPNTICNLKSTIGKSLIGQVSNVPPAGSANRP